MNKYRIILGLFAIFSLMINRLYSNEQAEIEPDRCTNIAVQAIKGWQKISFSTSLFNCQFEPCCSNYCIAAIRQKGNIKGILIGADRIARCHPMAFRYYLKNSKGYLYNIPDDNSFYVDRGLFSYSSIGLSMLVPGAHKMLHRRFYDGLSTLTLVGLSFIGGYHATLEGKNLLSVPLYTMGLTFYFSDIVTNFNSIKR